MAWTIGQVARLAGVSVRTLHHYDDIGLLRPSGRTAAGYRQYETADLERLQRVLAYRELGLPLEDVAGILADDGTDPLHHLRRQHTALTERAGRLHQLIETLETTMEAHRLGIRLSPQEMFEVFGDHDPTQYADEVEQRWGDDDAYRQSVRRSSGYTKDDWRRITAEGAEVEHAYAAAHAAGLPATSTEAMDAAEANLRYITRWFYDVSPQMHRTLGDMYVADERFTAHYEAVAAGLAVYVRDAIHANADRLEG